MEQITIGQIGLALTFIIGLISGINYIRIHLHKWISDSLKDQFELVDVQINKLQDQMNDIDIATCKNFLVSRLAEIERGLEWDEIEKERFWEQYEHYTKIGGNSYIQQKVDKMRTEGKL